MAEDQIRVQVTADTSPAEATINNRLNNLKVNVRAELNAASLENFSRPLGKLTGQADEFTKSMEAANARVLAFGASVGVVNGIASAFKNLVNSTLEVEKSLTEISVVGGKTFSNLQDVSAGIFSIAKQTGLSFRDAAEATLEFSRQGKSLEESLSAARAALVLTRSTGLDAAESVRGLTAAVNSFSDAGLSMADVVNKMAAVDAAFAVNSKDLIEGISRSASVAQEAGVSFDQLNALITTLQQNTGRGGAVIGNALKTIFTRVQNPEILKDIRELGISVQDSTGKFLPAVQILQNLGSEFENLDENVRKNILLKVGGGFQIDKLSIVLKDLANANGVYQGSLSAGLGAANNAFDRTVKLNQTLTGSFANLSTTAKEFGSNIGQVTFSKQFSDILNYGASKLESLNKAIFGDKDQGGEDEGSKFGKAILSGLGSVLSGPGVALFGTIILKLSYDFAKFSTTALQTLTGFNGKAKEEQSIQQSISSILTNNADIQQRLVSLEGDKVGQANLLLNIYTNIAKQAEKTALLSKDLAPALYQGGLRTSGGGIQVKGAAEGYVPDLSNAVLKEKQQAPSGAKVIIDHNFPMGGGERGTMVYNSRETRIPNFMGSGGDAIIPNYPISAAKGYTPNFAKGTKKDYAVGGKGELLIDARQVPLAGITFAGESNFLAKGKGKEITDSLLKDYVGSPFFDKLKEYDKINVTNIPVGNVYRFRKDLKEEEETIKADFVSRLNKTVRPQLISFISEEVKGLGLKPGRGLDENLGNLKLDILGSSAAGYILEEIIKAPTLTSSEEVAKYAAQSEKSYFDIYGLNAEDAEAYGLPKQRYAYADIKLGEKELKDTITKKFLNQAIHEGGGALKLKNAASGYIPNFAKTGFMKDDSVKLGNIFEDDLYRLLGVTQEQRPKKGAALDIPKNLLTSSDEELNKLGIATGVPFRSSWGDIKLSHNDESSLSLISKYFRSSGRPIEKSEKINASAENYSMLYKNGPPDSIRRRKAYLPTLVKENSTIINLVSDRLKFKNENKLNKRGESTVIDFTYNADKVLSAAGGYIPNFAETLLGEGVSAKFYDLGSGVGEKRFKPEFLEENPKYLKNEAEISKKLVELNSKLKIVRFPNILGSTKSTIKKEVITDPLARRFIDNIEGSERDKAVLERSLEQALYIALTPVKASGINPRDLHGDNFTVDAKAQSLLKSILAAKEAPSGEDLYRRLASENAMLTMIDSGEFVKQRPNKYEKAKFAKLAEKGLYTAANGYVPNFVAGVQQAIKREQDATGLPDSMIKVSKDNRAVHPTLNPTGLIVTNKMDEPSGASDVSNTRMASAYSNAGRGFVPSFALPAEQALGSTLEGKQIDNSNIQQKQNETTQKVISAEEELLKTLNINNNNRKKLIPILEKEMESILKLEATNKEEINAKAKQINAASAGGIKGGDKKIEEVINNILSQKDKFQKSQNQSSSGDSGVQTANTTENKNLTESVKTTKKEFSEIAAKLFVFQSGLSFVSGALSGFGDKASKVGESINDFGSALVGISQLSSLREAVVGTKKENETGLMAGGGVVRGVLGTALGVAGGIYVAVQAISAVDKAIQVMNGTFDKSKHFTDDLTQSLSKYNIQLTDQQKKVSENIANKAGASGAGISGYFNSIGLGGIFEKPDIAKIIESISKTGLDKGANTDLLNKLFNTIAPQASQEIFEKTGKKATSKQIEELTTEKISEKLEKIQIESRKSIGYGTTDYSSGLPVQINYTPIIKDLEDKIKKENSKNGGPNLKKIEDYQNKINKLKSNGELFILDEARYQEKIKEYLKDQIIPAQNAAIAEQERQESLLVSTELLKSQLNSYIQLSKIQSSIPSIKETELALEKELLTTTESRKLSLDSQIKSLAEQRQSLSDIKDVTLSFGKEKIEKYLTATSGTLDIRQGSAEDIRSSFSQIASATNSEQAQEALNNLFKKLKTSQSQTESPESKKIREDAITQLETQLDITKANSAARQVQNAIEAQNLSYLKQQSNEYNLRKDAINNQLTIQQKSVEYEKQKLELLRKSQDIKFETSQIGQPSIRASIAQADQNLINAQVRPSEDLRNELKQYDIAKKQSVANFMFQKNIKPEDVDRILKLPEKQQAQEITKILNDESTNLSRIVTDAGKDFYTKIVEAADLISDKLNPNSTNSIVDKLSNVNFENLTPNALKDLEEKLQKEKTFIQDYDNVDNNTRRELGEDGSKNSKIDELLKKINEASATKKQGYAVTTDLSESVDLALKASGPNQIDVKNKKGVIQDQIDLERKKAEETRKQITFKGGLESSYNELQNEIDTFSNKMGKDIPMAFRDGMVGAMRGLADTTKPLKESLLNVALAFTQKIQDALFTNLANQITAPITGMFAGKASGGPITGGSGAKDDVPAMLMGGEYVIKKSAAQKYGLSYLNALNSGTISKFADGGLVGWNTLDTSKPLPSGMTPYGQFGAQGIRFNDQGQAVSLDSGASDADSIKRAQTQYYAQNAQSGMGGFYTPGTAGQGAIMGQQNLLAFATQNTVSGQYDKISGSRGAASIDLVGGSENMTIRGLRNQDNLRNAEYLSSKSKAFDLYLGGISAQKEKVNIEEEARIERERIIKEAEQARKTQQRQMYQGIVRNFATSVAVAGLSKVADVAMKGGSNAVQAQAAKVAAGEASPLSTMGQMGTYFKGMWSGGGGMGGLSNVFSSTGYKSLNNYTPQKGALGEPILGQKTNYVMDNGRWTKIGNTNEDFNFYNPKGVNYSSNSSGFGSSNGPMQSSWTSGYKMPWMRAAGGYVPGQQGAGDNVPTMLSGGEFVMSKQAASNIGYGNLQQMNSGGKNASGGVSEEMISRLEAKLEELVEKTTGVGTININVDSSNSKDDKKQESGGSDKENRQLARQVKDAVLEVLRQEKRLGGMLR